MNITLDFVNLVSIGEMDQACRHICSFEASPGQFEWLTRIRLLENGRWFLGNRGQMTGGPKNLADNPCLSIWWLCSNLTCIIIKDVDIIHK
jgi:hypothetical protein